jgi:hypothetical protein
MGILDRVGTGAYEVPDRIDPGRTDLREQFLADPLGRHDLDLQLVVAATRSSLAILRWILVVTQPGQAWMVAEAGRRGEPPRLLTDRVFTDQAEAERYVFGLRWRALAGDGGGADG